MSVARVASLTAPAMASAAVAVGVGAYLAVHVSPALAAACATAGIVGGVPGALAANALLKAVDRVDARTGFVRALVGVWLAAVTAVLGTVTAGGPTPVVLALCVVVGAGWGLSLSVSRETVGTWGTQWMRRNGPLGRCGGAAGALAGAAIATSPLSILLLLPLAAGMLLLPGVHSTPHEVRSRRLRWDWAVFGSNFALALTGYGPVVLQVAFVASTAGAAWAGVSMLVYALVAMATPLVVPRLPARLHTDVSAWLVLAALSDLMWLVTFVHPLLGMLAARAFSGLAIFAAEGSADIAAFHQGASSSASAGRTAGGAAAGLLGTLMLSVAGAQAVAVVFAGAALTILAVVVARRAFSARRSEEPAVD